MLQPVANISVNHSLSLAQKISPDEMYGLEPLVFLTKGAKVMLTMNLWPKIGLCNEATGKVVHIVYQTNDQPPDLPIAVIVKFDNYTGPSISETTSACVSICPVTVAVQLANGLHERQQLPLKLAWSMTIHKTQGLTLSKAWIDIGKSQKTPGKAYVASSRVKSLSSCVIEPVTYEQVTGLKSSSSLQYRLDEETRRDRLASATCLTYNASYCYR